MKTGVLVFPGSNCDRDAFDAAAFEMRSEARFLWHDERQDLAGYDLIIVPGGFSYGDHLRCGAIARFSPVMQDVKRFAERGGLVIGICNGFQILTESGLLPGALLRNRSLHFICDQVTISVENNTTPFSSLFAAKQRITLPIAHAEGNYYADAETLARLEDNGQVVFRYVDDVNGAANRIAGICNTKGNVLGMMPHPERNLWPSNNFTGDGKTVFQSIIKSLNSNPALIGV
ncbi:MAG: phosphoribosylformylglycinamidine synthase subunit PurQ [Vampirovibrionales bacterium]|nr:phosphoribosylformylglycinamidine synthase subunit PurQ [Vampirovibrionales bacterium]